jgi:hypothetical protein
MVRYPSRPAPVVRGAVIHRFLAVLCAFAGLILSAGCSTVPSTGETTRAAVFDPDLFGPWEFARDELDLVVEERELEAGSSGSRLRVEFSFVAYRDYLEEGAALRSTGVVWFPTDADGRARIYRAPTLITEFPPGSSSSGISVHEEYGERPAAELGIVSAVVDLRGPVVRELRDFTNPDDPLGVPFADEEQFAYAMLRSFQESADPTLLWEYRVAEAWLRAVRVVQTIVADETGLRRSRFLLVGEGYGAIGAAQAAALIEPVDGLVLCGWPLDWPDLHFTRWRRWEREARYFPLLPIQPMAYRDSREVLSFLFSSFSNPDPGCPSCAGSGLLWRAQFNVLDLMRDGRLAGVRTLVLVGDSDPRFPIDLEARACVQPEELAALPVPSPEYEGGPFAARLRLPFHGLRYLQRSPSTIAHPEAVEATFAWIQHLNGQRDLARVRVTESVEDGKLRLDIVVREGDAAPVGVEVHLTEIEDRHDFDFKHGPHRKLPEPVVWRRIDAFYARHERDRVSVWKAFVPVNPTRNGAYYVVVRDAVGGLESAHSLPIRPLWNLGDPAFGPAR